MRSYLLTAVFAALLALFSVVSLIIFQNKGLMAGAATGLFLVGIIFLAWAWLRTGQMLALAFLVLMCTPFFLGFSRTPRIFLNELPLLLLIAVVPLKVLWRAEPLRVRPMDIICLLFMGLLLTSMTMFYHPISNVDLRIYIETLVLGTLLCLVCAQEANEDTVILIIKTLAGAVIFISFAGLTETIAAQNPVMDYAARVAENQVPLYMSAEEFQAAGGAYRPYVNFSHPSEGATVVALCLPFIIMLWREARYRPLVTITLILASGYLLINATRGVWLALLTAGFLFAPRFRKTAIFCLPLGLGAVALALLFFGESSYMERIFDVQNLRIRFFYWDLALDYLEQNWLLGAGFSYFKNIYLDLNPVVPADIAAAVDLIAAVDNSFLLILVEQGVIGLFGYFVIWSFTVLRLVRARRSLITENRLLSADFARAGLVSLTIFLVCGLLADVHLFWVATKMLFMLTGLAWGLAAGREGGTLDLAREA